MTPISEFFDIDLIEEQHKWELSQIAYFYQTTEDDVLKALSRANKRFRDNPLSTSYSGPDSISTGSECDASSTQPCGDVHGHPGEDGAEACQGMASGGCSP